MDLIADFAYPLPTTVIAELLGVPTTDRPMFKRWADALFARQLSDTDLIHAEVVELEQRPDFQRAKQATLDMEAYFERALDERRREPHNDLMSELLAAEVEGERLTGDELLSFCILLLLAGHVTTTNLLGNAMLCLDEHPDQMEKLRAEPELTASAVEEILRHASPVWRLIRRPQNAVEIGGKTIPAGAVVFAWLASANRDEEQFPDPTRFDVARTPNKHVAFGHGIHFCVGAPLARMEASIALPMLLAQLPHLRRGRGAPLEMLTSSFLFGVKKLPVTFTASPSLQTTGGKTR
jgi:cytochrome P450